MDQMYSEIKFLGYIPDEKTTFWLYTLDVCEIDKRYLAESDSEVFAYNAKNCQLFYFDDFNKCLAFIEQTYEVSFSDFCKIGQTNYPKY